MMEDRLDQTLLLSFGGAYIASILSDRADQRSLAEIEHQVAAEYMRRGLTYADARNRARADIAEYQQSQRAIAVAHKPSLLLHWGWLTAFVLFAVLTMLEISDASQHLGDWIKGLGAVGMAAITLVCYIASGLPEYRKQTRKITPLVSASKQREPVAAIPTSAKVRCPDCKMIWDRSSDAPATWRCTCGRTLRYRVTSR